MSEILTNTNNDERMLAEIDHIVQEIGTGEHAVIPILQAIQDRYRYLPQDALRRVCEITDITPASISGVSTFYTQFRHKPVGKHMIQVCNGTACHVKNAGLVHDAFNRELHIADDGDTDPSGNYTLQKVACLGCCTLAPVVQIDEITYGHVTPEGISKVLNDFESQENSSNGISLATESFPAEAGEIRIGLGSCCVASGSQKVKESLQQTLLETGIQTNVKRVGCVGMCHRTPLMEICKPGQESVLYEKVKPEEVRPIILKHFRPYSLRNRIKTALTSFVERVLSDENANGISRHALHVRDPLIETFLGRQKHIATEHAGHIDPLDIQEYRMHHGFLAVRRCLLDLTPTEVIDIIEQSGLRGRGGAGFPTARKWRIASEVEDDIKYVICNGDEGDPGAFMDRMILESYPYRVIEGMMISAYAVGATDGYFYIRAEYPLAVQRINSAIQRCEEQGLLGDNILGSGFSFRLKVMEGAGAFVCGEETALIASIEGKRGMPVLRPPYPVESGLWGHSTLVNNCETLATVPWIIRNGPEELTKYGTESSPGTKVFSLAGKIARGGLIEVPMGITIREIVEEIGGGIENNKRFKAVQIGGPSGGCVPAELADTKIDYEDLHNVGAMMGSGGLLVMDEADCMVSIARYFLSFTYDQSCGKCTYCRIGTRQMLVLLDKICSGKGKKGDLEKLEELAGKTKSGSLCGLGKTAPNPVLSTLTYFRHEYEAHLEGRCPAKSCQDLIEYNINNKCIGCTICAQQCPVDAIPLTPYETHHIIQENCTKCDTCFQVCPVDAIEIN